MPVRKLSFTALTRVWNDCGRIRDVASALIRLEWGKVLVSPRQFGGTLLATSLDALGGSFVKFSQVLSHSPALVPSCVATACKASLAHCSAPTMPYNVVIELIRNELGKDTLDRTKPNCVFASIDVHPLASASIAQVHAATLVSGERCVLKVVRPEVQARLEVDMAFLVLLARAADVTPRVGFESTRPQPYTPEQSLQYHVRRVIIEPTRPQP